MTEPGTIEVFTFGHSNMSPEDLISILVRHQIEVVVDVRSVPYSQYTPHFNREALAPALHDAGIDYTFAGEYLGGRPDDPTCYNNGQVPKGRADFLQLVDYAAVASRPWFLKGIERLKEIAISRRAALMCSEEDPSRCHRHHLIAQSLMERGVKVWHIRRTGNIEQAQQHRSVGNVTQQQLALALE